MIGNEKFTPGPWEVWTSAKDNSVNVSKVGTHEFVCEVGKIAEGEAQGDVDRIRADALLIASAPTLAAENSRLKEVNAELVSALDGLEMLYDREMENPMERFDRIADVFYHDTGYLRPGKDCRVHSPEVREAAWKLWIDAKLSAARSALTRAREGK